MFYKKNQEILLKFLTIFFLSRVSTKSEEKSIKIVSRLGAHNVKYILIILHMRTRKRKRTNKLHVYINMGFIAPFFVLIICKKAENEKSQQKKTFLIEEKYVSSLLLCMSGLFHMFFESSFVICYCVCVLHFLRTQPFSFQWGPMFLFLTFFFHYKRIYRFNCDQNFGAKRSKLEQCKDEINFCRPFRKNVRIFLGAKIKIFKF